MLFVQIKAAASSQLEGRLKLWMLFTLLFSYLCWLAEGLDIHGVQSLGVLVSVVRSVVVSLTLTHRVVALCCRCSLMLVCGLCRRSL